MFDHCLYFNTTALARVVEREWAKAFQPFGLTPPQAFLLRVVIAKPGMSHHELASVLTVARPTATRLLDGLQGLGLIERRQLKEDARHWSIHPTKKGILIGDSVSNASVAVTKKLQAQLGKDEFQDAVSRVRSVCAALK